MGSIPNTLSRSHEPPQVLADCQGRWCRCHRSGSDACYGRGPWAGAGATRQIALGIEATGPYSARGNRILEIGCVELLASKLTGNNKHSYLNSGRDGHEDALPVHGLSAEFLRDKPRFEVVADELIEYLRGAEIIAHNALFDVGLLNTELGLTGRSRWRKPPAARPIR